MLEEEMRVGSKGQVVIPRALRKALKIEPGMKIVFRLEEGRLVIERARFDAVRLFTKIARKGASVEAMTPHEYEEELTSRGS